MYRELFHECTGDRRPGRKYCCWISLWPSSSQSEWHSFELIKFVFWFFVCIQLFTNRSGACLDKVKQIINDSPDATCLCSRLFLLARAPSSREPSAHPPAVDDGWDVCFFVPLPGHGHSRQLKCEFNVNLSQSDALLFYEGIVLLGCKSSDYV